MRTTAIKPLGVKIKGRHVRCVHCMCHDNAQLTYTQNVHDTDGTGGDVITESQHHCAR